MHVHILSLSDLRHRRWWRQRKLGAFLSPIPWWIHVRSARFQVTFLYCYLQSWTFLLTLCQQKLPNISMNHYSIVSKYFARMTWLILMAMSADGHCHLFCFQSLVFLWCWLKWLACCSVVCIGIILHFAAQGSIKMDHWKEFVSHQ